MPKALVLLLLCFWLYLAFTALSAGDTTRAVIYLVIGGALTAWRWSKLRGSTTAN